MALHIPHKDAVFTMASSILAAGTMTYIYTLSDKSGIRYIGKSNNPFYRFKIHLKECKRKKTRKEKWINSLLKRGELPIVEILEEIEEVNWQFFEIYWISQFKAWGFSILNGTDGGEGSNGFKGRKHSEKSKNKVRKTINKFFLDKAEKKKEISTKLKLFYKKNPEYNSKKIFQYDLDETFIKETTINQAHKELKIPKSNIVECAKGRRNTAGKYIWKYNKIEV